jgi:hypothetical protein
MTSWDILNKVLNGLSPTALALLLVSAVAGVIIFIIGFAKRGMNFVKYGFGQTMLDSSLEKRFDALDARMDTRMNALDTRIDGLDARIGALDTRIGALDARIDGLDTRISAMDTRISTMDARIEMIEVNHFGHLKGYLRLLNGVLLDKDIVNNEMKARLDNELEGM